MTEASGRAGGTVLVASPKFAAAALAFRAAVKAAAGAHLTEGHGFGVPADACCDLPGSEAEIARALDLARRAHPADRFDLQHHFRWTADGVEHLIQPHAKH